MANFNMRANICTYFKNGSLLVSSAQNIDILSGSNRSVCTQTHSQTVKHPSTHTAAAADKCQGCHQKPVLRTFLGRT